MSSTIRQTSTIIRAALVLETVANIAAAICMVVLPDTSLGALGISSPSALAKQLIMYFAGCVIALTVPLILSVPNKPGIVGLRRVTYATMLAGEVALLLIMIVQGLGWRGYAGKSAQGGVGGAIRELKEAGSGGVFEEDYVKGGSLLLAMGNMAGLAMWRVFCLFVRPVLMGEEGTTEKKAQ